MSAKIFVIFHKNVEPIIKDNVLTPMMVGKKGEEESKISTFNGEDSIFIFDNVGENIANKNPIFNELTGIYWVYKNFEQIGCPDYVGFCHYRRYFSFSHSKKIYYEMNTDDTRVKDFVSLKASTIVDIFKDYDFIAPYPAKRASVLKNYKRAHNLQDVSLTREIVKEHHLDYLDCFDRYFSGKRSFFHNMFIFKKDDFFRYCEWIFNILFKLEEKKDSLDYRMYISERLTGVFISKLEEEANKGLFLPTIYLTSKKPSFKEALYQTKANLQLKEKSLLYRLKPIIIYFIPQKFLQKRREKTVK